MKKETDNWLSAKGCLAIFPEIKYGRHIGIVIIGDSEGLSNFAEILKQLADMDQNSMDIPTGARAHIQLVPEAHLAAHSSTVEICRADAKGTNEFPPYLEDEIVLRRKEKKRRGKASPSFKKV